MVHRLEGAHNPTGYALRRRVLFFRGLECGSLRLRGSQRRLRGVTVRAAGPSMQAGTQDERDEHAAGQQLHPPARAGQSCPARTCGTVNAVVKPQRALQAAATRADEDKTAGTGHVGGRSGMGKEGPVRRHSGPRPVES